MSIQTSLMKASARIQQRLFDQNIHTTGREVDGIKITFKEDIFQNTEEEVVFEYEDVTATIIYPTDIPIDRYRMDSGLQIAETRTFFFDLLPIEIYSKFENGFEKDDFLFHFFVDEHQNKVPMLLQITETFGRFTTDLIWRKYYAAPKNGKVPSQITDLIQSRYNI